MVEKDKAAGGSAAVREERQAKQLGPQKPTGATASIVERTPFKGTAPANESIISGKSTRERCVDEASAKIAELREVSESNSELRAGVAQVLHDIASRNDVEYTPTVVKLLMRHWTERRSDGQSGYDEHMAGHVEAIKCMFTAWGKDRYNWNRKLRVLDASCGTGTVLKAFLDSLPSWLLSRVRVTANDISEDAIEAAKKTLKRHERRVVFERNDIAKKLPKGKFDVIILSQTLPFITDDTAVKMKRLGQTIRQDEESHIEAKKRLIVRLLGKLKGKDSEFLLVDEEPMQFSKGGDTPEEVIEEVLFNEVFRKIEKDKLTNDVLKDIEGARFIGHLETIIDREHDMYLIASRRVIKKGHKQPKAEERPSICPIETVNGLRNLDADELEILRHMENVYPYLAERLRQFNGDSDSLRPITGTRLVIDKRKHDEEIRNNPFYWKRNGTNDLVIVSGLVHELGKEGYKGLIRNLKSSGKVKPGSLLLFMDQWPPPTGLEQPANRMGNSDARLQVFKSPDHTFLGSYRSGNKYGYLYVIRELTSPQISQSED